MSKLTPDPIEDRFLDWIARPIGVRGGSAGLILGEAGAVLSWWMWGNPAPILLWLPCWAFVWWFSHQGPED